MALVSALQYGPPPADAHYRARSANISGAEFTALPSGSTPAEQLIAVLMLLAPDRRLYYRHLLRPLVYGAVTGPIAG
jgi:hypothetical protein